VKELCSFTTSIYFLFFINGRGEERKEGGARQKGEGADQEQEEGGEGQAEEEGVTG